MSLRELETFLKWLQEAETTVNVLADASQREDLSQDTAHVKELRRQLEVGGVERNTLARPSLIEVWLPRGVAFVRNLQVRILRMLWCSEVVPLLVCAKCSSLILLTHPAWKFIVRCVCTSGHICASTNCLVITQTSHQKSIDTHPGIIYVMF